MSLGEKLQAAAEKVYTKLGTQEGIITFRRFEGQESDVFGLPHQNVNVEEVAIAEGCKVDRVKAFEANEGAGLRMGDLKLFVPGHLLTEDQLNGGVVDYLDKRHIILNYRANAVFSSVVVEWVVYARVAD